MAKTFLDRAGLVYDVVVADEDVESTRMYGVKQAPTLVAVTGNEVERIVNVSNIRRYTDELATTPVQG